jgi:hypothetical protein
MTNNQIKRINHVAPFFSLIMPVYNGQKFLQQALESVLQQTFTDFELLVVDDGSTDASAAIVQGFTKQDARVKYFKQPANRGLSAARNTGLANAQGKYVGFCDADDYLEAEALQTVYKSLQKQTADLVIFGLYEDYYDETWQLTARGTKVATAGLFTGEAEIIPEVLCLLRDNLYQYTWNKFYKLAWLREQQVQFEKIPFCEDVVFNLKLCHTLVSMLVVPAALYHYRRSEHASLTTYYTENFLQAHFRLLGQEYDILKEQNFLTKALPILSELCVRYAFVGLQMAFHAQAPRDAFALHYQQLQAFTHFKELVTYGKDSLPGLKGILAWVLASDNKLLIKVVSWCIFVVKHRFIKLWCWLK